MTVNSADAQAPKRRTCMATCAGMIKAATKQVEVLALITQHALETLLEIKVTTRRTMDLHLRCYPTIKQC